MERVLSELPDQMALLPLLLHSSGGGSADGLRTVPGPRTPNVAVMDLLDTRVKLDGEVDMAGLAEIDRMAGDNRQGVLPELWLWAVLIEAERFDADPQLPPELPDEPTIANLCGWLLDGIAWVAEQQWSEELDHDLRRIGSAVRGMLQERDEYRPKHTEAGGCGWPFEARDNRTWYRCTGCGKVVDHWAEMRRVMAVQRVTLRQAAELTAIPLDTLRRWKKAGVITPALNRGQGRSGLYDLDTLRRAAETLGRAVVR